jgi:hypothetical protein
MKAGALAALVVGAGVFVLGAVYVTRSRAPVQSVAREGESALLLPGLDAQRVSRVKFTRGEKSTTLSRVDGEWTIEAMDGHPASGELVRKAIRPLTEATVLEEKTSSPDLYARIGVEDPTASGATGTLAELMDDSGKVLASVIVGKRSQSRNDESGATFVRVQGEATAKLIAGGFMLGAEPKDWFEHTVFQLTPGSVRTVRAMHASGEVVLTKPAQEGADPVVENIPEGRELGKNGAHDRAMNALASVYVERGAMAGSIDMANAATTAYTLDSGVTYSVRVRPGATSEEMGWIALSAAYSPAGEANAAIQKQVDDFNAKFGPWVYEVQAYKVREFVPTMDDLTIHKGQLPEAIEGAQEVSPEQLPTEILEQLRKAPPHTP